MGEIAEMMLNGDLCEGCGGFIDFEDGGGFPRYCSPQCARDRGIQCAPATASYKGTPCPDCGKMCAGKFAVAQHRRDKHGVQIDGK
jgi:hypothetical protein